MPGVGTVKVLYPELLQWLHLNCRLIKTVSSRSLTHKSLRLPLSPYGSLAASWMTWAAMMDNKCGGSSNENFFRPGLEPAAGHSVSKSRSSSSARNWLAMWSLSSLSTSTSEVLFCNLATSRKLFCATIPSHQFRIGHRLLGVHFRYSRSSGWI